jgi:uroporphyrinogen decarboxylase
MPADGFYFDRLEKYPGALHPDLDSWSVPRLSDDELEHYARTARDLYTNTDRAIITALGPPYELFNGIGQGGFEDWMITFASEPNYVADLYQILTDAWIENLQLLHQAVGPRLHILQICDDFGTQRAPFLSVQMFRERLLPAYKRGLDWIHTHTPWKVMLHSDGALYPLLPSIVEMGVDILNPVQTSAAGMDAKRLKSEFGQQLVFWGGSCDPQTTLRSGSPDAVAAETRANLEILSPGGGYVFAPVHNLQADVPPENILALIGTAQEWSDADRHAPSLS